MLSSLQRYKRTNSSSVGRRWLSGSFYGREAFLPQISLSLSMYMSVCLRVLIRGEGRLRRRSTDRQTGEGRVGTWRSVVGDASRGMGSPVRIFSSFSVV